MRKSGRLGRKESTLELELEKKKKRRRRGNDVKGEKERK
jgi:hypothetical protein